MIRPAEIVVPVPGSKSDAIRALLIGALARGTTRIERAPTSDDFRAVAGAVAALGVRVEGGPGSDALRVRGTEGRLPPGDRSLDLGGSATGLRLLACVAALREGRTLLDGDASLRRRPMGSLIAALRALGLRVRARGDRAPLEVESGPVGRAPDPLFVDAGTTSQVASGLLLAGPILPGGLRLRFDGRPVSSPYVALTIAALRRAGVRVRSRAGGLAVDPRVPEGATVRVEADWSSAAYALLGSAILGRPVRVPGLDRRSPQADRAILGLLRPAGVRCGADRGGAWCAGTGRVGPFRVELRDAPDLAPAAAALALFAEGECRVSDAAHLRGKESDRIASCVAALRALGRDARETGDGFVVAPGEPSAGTVDPRGDHRIALAFGVAAAAIPGARVLDRGCVAKSWPTAWEDLGPLLGAGAAVGPEVSLPPPSGRG